MSNISPLSLARARGAGERARGVRARPEAGGGLARRDAGCGGFGGGRTFGGGGAFGGGAFGDDGFGGADDFFSSGFGGGATFSSLVRLS